MVVGGRRRSRRSSRKSGAEGGKAKQTYGPSEFYCMKEKKKVSDPNFKVVRAKNGKNAKTGKCSCGTKLYMFTK
jgi:hypothetical protein